LTKKEGTGLNFWGASYVLLQPYLKPFERYFQEMSVDLSRAGFRITYRAYVAGMVLASAIGFVAGGVAGTLLAYYLNTFMTFRVLIPFGLSVMGGALTFGAFYLFPQLRANSRRGQLDSELSYTVSHMAVLASAGMTPEKMFHSLAEEGSKDVVDGEAAMIVRDMSLLGMDLQHALQAEQKRSPSEKFSDFLDGFISSSKTGGDLKTYLLRAASSMMLDKRLKARAVSESVGLIAELYTIILVVMPLLLLIMFSVIGMVAGSIGGFNILTLIYLITYVMVPLGGLTVLIMADSTVGKEE